MKIKVTANYATYPGKGRLKALKQSIDSIIDQVDLVRVYYNGSIHDRHKFEGIDLMDKVEITCGKNITDLGKFHGLREYGTELYLTCDDDIIFPSNYVVFTKKMVELHKCIVTYNGRVLVKESTYYGGKHILFDYRRQQEKDVVVDVPGTGVMAFRTDYFCPVEILDSPFMKMSDLVFALQARQEKKRIICARRSLQWLKGIYLQGIWHEFNQGPKAKAEIEQVKLMKQIIDYGRK